MPKFPGQETATFPIKHNNDIRDPKEIPLSDVVIVGAGPSAMDMIQQSCLTQEGSNIHLVARSPHWYVTRQPILFLYYHSQLT